MHVDEILNQQNNMADCWINRKILQWREAALDKAKTKGRIWTRGESLDGVKPELREFIGRNL